jgi:putative membrane protein
MTKKFMICMSLAGALIGAATGAWAQTKAQDKAAQTFIIKAIQGNLAEVAMGQLAQQNAESADVRQFGQQLVADHTAGAQKASAVASQLGVTPPTEPSKKHKSDYAKMAKMSGAAFDRAFARHMVADHRMEIAEHRKAAKMKNETVASYATGSLPVLEKHLEMAQALAKSAGGTGRSGKGGGGKPSM